MHTEKRDAARGGSQEAGQHLDGGGLARAVGTQESEKLSRCDAQVDVVDSNEFSETASKALGRDGGGGVHETSESSTGARFSGACLLLSGGAACFFSGCFVLEQIPQELVVNLVMELHFGSFHERSERSWAAIGGGLFQVRVAILYVFSEKRRRPVGFAGVRQRFINVVRQIALRLSQDFGLL